MTVSKARLALAVVSALCFGLLTVLSLRYLSPEGMMIFDAHVTGYDLNFARTYVGALGLWEQAVYTGPFRVIDTLFPLCLGAFLALLLYQATRSWSVVSQMLLLLFPGGFVIMDLCENALVALIVSSELSALRADLVDRASNFTVMKYGMLGASLVIIAGASVFHRRSA